MGSRLLVSDPCRTVEDAQASFAGLVEHGFVLAQREMEKRRSPLV
jgi:hypothetical protein